MTSTVCPVLTSALSSNAGTLGGQSREQKVHRHAVRLAQGGVERLPSRVVSRRLRRERQGRTHLVEHIGLKPRRLRAAAGGRLVLRRQGALDVRARLPGKWRGILTGATGEQAAAS